MIYPIFQPNHFEYSFVCFPFDEETCIELYDLNGEQVNLLKVSGIKPVSFELSTVFPCTLSREFRMSVGYLNVLSGIVSCYLKSASFYLSIEPMRLLSGNSVIPVPPVFSFLIILNLNQSGGFLKLHRDNLTTSIKLQRGVSCLPFETIQGTKIGFLSSFYVSFVPKLSKI